jgi:hypothetical protein
MVSDHHRTFDPSSDGPGETAPLALRVDSDGIGSASFDWEQVLDTLTRGLERHVRGALGEDVAVIGVRFIDADGRAVTGPAPNGITLVGFTTTQ